MSELGLRQLRLQNVTRSLSWHKDAEPWTGADWCTAVTGEWGEAANNVKKLRRAETGARNDHDPDPEVLVDRLAEELADTVIYIDLLAAHYGIDLADAIVMKFNKTSREFGFPQKLERLP